MKTLPITGIDTYLSNANTKAIEAIDAWIREYDNVTYIGNITISYCTRYIYDIGHTNTYLTIESASTTNSNIYVCLMYKDHAEEAYSSSTGRARLQINGGNRQADGKYYSEILLYFFSKNNNLYAFTGCTLTGTPNAYIAWNSDYIYISNTVYADDLNNSVYCISDYFPNVSYNQSEKALMSKAYITATNANGAVYIDESDDVYKIVNTQFQSMTFTLIDIDGKRYRNVGANYLFIENGDDV